MILISITKGTFFFILIALNKIALAGNEANQFFMFKMMSLRNIMQLDMELNYPLHNA